MLLIFFHWSTKEKYSKSSNAYDPLCTAISAYRNSGSGITSALAVKSFLHLNLTSTVIDENAIKGLAKWRPLKDLAGTWQMEGQERVRALWLNRWAPQHKNVQGWCKEQSMHYISHRQCNGATAGGSNQSCIHFVNGNLVLSRLHRVNQSIQKNLGFLSICTM